MAAVPADLSINARWILPMTTRGLILEAHSLIVRDGRIAEILPRAEARMKYAPTMTVDRPAHLLMPGLVNAHTNAAMSLFRDIAAGLPLNGRLSEIIRPLERRFVNREFVHDGVLVSIAGMLKTGVTCFGDMYMFPGETARTAALQGMRAVIGMPVSDIPSPWAKGCDECLSRALAVHDEYRDHPFISTAFAPQATLILSDEALTRVLTLANELDAGIFIRMHESTAAVGESLQRHGRRPLERLEDLGLLTPALNAIHMTHLNDEDIARALRTGIAVTLCPESNLKSGSPPPPIAALASAGMRLGVGSDGPATNGDQDLWSEIKLLTLLSRQSGDSAHVVAPWDALAAATRGGASALGCEAQIGTLETGKWADRCCMDLSCPSTQPLYDPLTQLVFSGGREMVTDVWVGGRLLLAESGLTRLDWPGVSARATAWASRLGSGGQ